MANHLFAAIDVGSFELELGIYEISPKSGIRQIDHLRHVIALGRETYHTGKISYRLVDEMCRVLEDFSKVMKGYRVEDYWACATSAMREAVNNQIILDQIEVRTGIKVQIISNSEQRFLSYKAIAMKASEFEKIIQKGTAIADVGFGSTQLSLFDKDSLVTTQNIVPGVLKIRDILSTIQVNKTQEKSVVEEIIDHELIKFKKLYLRDRDIKHLIGVGDTIMILVRKASEGDAPDRMTREQFNQVYDQLMSLSASQIEDTFGVNEGFASILIPSAIIYNRILQMTGAEMVWTPGIRLCDGVVTEYAQQNRWLKFTHDFEEDMLAAARNTAKRYRCGNAHVLCVENMAARMFDAMKKYHGLAQRDRILLRIAAILYGCGKYVTMRNFADCSYNIIMSTEIIGLSQNERELVANVVRHYQDEYEYDEADIRTAKLTAMLRLAVALDVSYKQKLAGCRMGVRGDNLVISTEYPGDLSLEAMTVGVCAGFFEEIFGIQPMLKQKRRV